MQTALVSDREESRRRRDLELPECVRRYLSGESLQAIALEKRVHRRTIYYWMMTGLGDEAYQALVTEVLVARVADADEELELARMSGDPVRVSAAKETARFARMDLERRRPALYGQKQEVKHTGAAPSFTVVLLDRPSGGGGAVLGGTQVPSLPAVVGGGEEEKGEADGVRQG